MDTRDFDDVDVLEMIDAKHMAFLDCTTSREAIESLVSLLMDTRSISNKEQVVDAVLHREKIVSTGIGLGIALPHARLDNIEQFFIVVGIQKTNSIIWASLDHVPVRIIFLIVGPQQQDALYLKVLSKLTEIIRTPEIRNQLLQAKEISDLVHLFETCYSAV